MQRNKYANVCVSFTSLHPVSPLHSTKKVLDVCNAALLHHPSVYLVDRHVHCCQKLSQSLIVQSACAFFSALIALKPQFTLSCSVITLFSPYLCSAAKPFIIILWGEFNVLRNQISFLTLSIWENVLLAAPLDRRNRQRQAWKWHHRHFFYISVKYWV